MKEINIARVIVSLPSPQLLTFPYSTDAINHENVDIIVYVLSDRKQSAYLIAKFKI